MFDLLEFTVLESGYIFGRMNVSKKLRLLNYDSIIQVLSYLAIGPMAVTEIDSWSEKLEWLFPLSLAKFLFDKYEREPRAMVCSLKTYLIMHDRPLMVIQGELIKNA